MDQGDCSPRHALSAIFIALLRWFLMPSKIAAPRFEIQLQGFETASLMSTNNLPIIWAIVSAALLLPSPASSMNSLSASQRGWELFQIVDELCDRVDGVSNLLVDVALNTSLESFSLVNVPFRTRPMSPLTQGLRATPASGECNSR